MLQKGCTSKDFIFNKKVIIYGDSVPDLKHEFIFMPLAFTLKSQMITDQEARKLSVGNMGKN